MKSGKKKLIALIAAITAVVCIVAVVLIQVFTGGHRVIKVNTFEGAVELARNDEPSDIMEGMNLKSEDMITTGVDGVAELLADEDKVIVAQPNTCFAIKATGDQNKGKLQIELQYGATVIDIANKLPDGSEFDVTTANASLSVRGTTFSVRYDELEKVTVVITNDGVVEVSAGGQSVMVNAGEMAIVEDDTITVEKTFAYTNQPMFEATILEEEQGSGLHVYELVEWQHTVQTVNGIRVDEMVRDDLNIRYWVQTEADILDNIDRLRDGGFLMGQGSIVNTDGDVIRWTMTGQDGKPFTYRYYKPISEDYYLHLNVYVADGTTFKPGDTLEKYLILTNDCYYIMDGSIQYETDEAVEIPISEEDIPNLVAGGITYEELEFMIRVADTQRLYPVYNTVWQTLDIMRYEPGLPGVYEPISGTDFSFDVEQLNRLFPAFTFYRAEAGELPQYAKIEGNTLILEPNTAPREFIVKTEVQRMYIDENNELCIEYISTNIEDVANFHGFTATVVSHMVLNEEGKYETDYCVEGTRERF